MNNTDVYSQLWHRLLPLYDKEEAVAIARLVLDTLFQLSLTDIVMGRADELSVADRQRLNDVADQLVKGVPVQYALHECVFCDHVFHVAPGVLIPRPETEELCRKVIADNATLPCPHILDVGTGSGCIAITLALALPEANVEAIDLSKEALAIASDNALRLGAKVTFAEQDALRLTAAPQPLWDAIVSNPPYVTEKERADMRRNVLDYEPALALFVPDDDPLRFYRAITQYAMTALREGGRLYFEINPLYADEMATLLHQQGFSDVDILKDAFGKQRFACGRK